uniref:Elongation factor 1-beta n=1 Tax=Ditylenchus dipsaci TaxID=166011 RepID=A0A915DX10_9BILA
MSALSFSQGKVNSGDAKELDEFNTYLSTKSYVNGFAPSKEDEVAFKSFTSFEGAEKSSWPQQSQGDTSEGKPAAAADDDFDLFGDEESEDDEEKERVKQERLKAYAEKKSKKPGPIAKSTIIFDVKPWDDTIKVENIEAHVRSITTEGLIWDDKVSSDWLEEMITANEELVQSVDVVAFNKV